MSRFIDPATASAGIKLIIFLVVTALSTALLAITIANITFGAKTEYQAVFADVTSLNNGDDIRIAGVKVGAVENIEIVDRDRALVTFTVDSDLDLPESTEVAIRYRNLIGQRYLDVTQGAGSAEPLDEGAVIPISQTRPALDLTLLFNGFKPLFAALSPDDLNELASNIIQVFEGQGGTVESLLASTASLTNEIADRDQLIGDLIANLNSVLETLGDRDEELTSLIIELQTFISGLEDDSAAILGSLDSINSLATETATFARDLTPPLVTDLEQLRQVVTTLDDNRQVVDATLQILPIKLEKVGRTALYGSFFNFFLCGFAVDVTLLDDPNVIPGLDLSVLNSLADVPVTSFNQPRCSL